MAAICEQFCALMLTYNTVAAWRAPPPPLDAPPTIPAAGSAGESGAATQEPATADARTIADEVARALAASESVEEPLTPPPHECDCRSGPSGFVLLQFSVLFGGAGQAHVCGMRRLWSQKADAGRRRVWQDMQRHVATCLDKFSLAAFSLERFLQLLGLVRTLVQIGESFSGQTAATLEAAIHRTSLNFVASVHRCALLSVRDRITAEDWRACDIPEGFNIYFLRECVWPAAACHARR